MGTRSLTAVMIDGKYKIAQYGQWDGYPSGQGLTVLKFLQNTDINIFKEKCRKVRFLTDDEIKEIDINYNTNWKEHYPQLSRDHGAKILNLVLLGATELINSISFAGDSLFCEYAYVVDFDKNSFEIYEGFNKDKITKGRFISGDSELHIDDEYEPIKIIKEYQLDNLPGEKMFLSDLKKF